MLPFRDCCTNYVLLTQSNTIQLPPLTTPPQAWRPGPRCLHYPNKHTPPTRKCGLHWDNSVRKDDVIMGGKIPYSAHSPRSALTLRVLEVVSPQGSDLVLATHIPHCETDILVFHCLHIKTYKRKSTQNIGNYVAGKTKILAIANITRKNR